MQPSFHRLIQLLAACLLFVGSGCHAATDFRGGFATMADGARIHYVEGGGGHGMPTLLFIPGWTMDAGVWQAQMRRFAPDYPVLAIDPRSQGESSKTADGNTPEQRARDLAELMKQRDLHHVVLVAWSQGVQDAAAYVSQFGTARLDGIVLVDAAVSSGPEYLTLHPQAARATFGRMAIYAARPHAYMQGLMQAVFRKPLGAEEMKRMVEGSLRTPTSTGIAMLMMDLFAIDRRPALAKFDKPTLVIAAGTSSELADQQAGAKRMPDARFVAIANAGHAVFHDQPEAFAKALRGFLATLPPIRTN